MEIAKLNGKIEHFKRELKRELINSARRKVYPQINNFVTGEDVKLDENLNIPYGGIFSFPKGSLFLLNIILDEKEELENNMDKAILFLNSSKGKQLQKYYFNKDYIKKVKKMIKSRDITDKELGQYFIKLMMFNSLEPVVRCLKDKYGDVSWTYLDALRCYYLTLNKSS